MALGRRLLIYSPRDPKASSLIAATHDWGCLVTTCQTLDELRGRIEGGEYDVVLVEDSQALRRLVNDSDPTGTILETPLAEIEKRHLLRVLSSTGGNKTRAAKLLGIDTKTLYNKLKSYNHEAKPGRPAASRMATNGRYNGDVSMR
jgi:DNA-binding protein Fis